MTNKIFLPPVRITDQNLSGFLKSLSTGLLLLDGVGRVVLANEAARELLPIEEGALSTTTLPELEEALGQTLSPGESRLYWVAKYQTLLIVSGAQWPEHNKGFLVVCVPGRLLDEQMTRLPSFQEMVLEREAIIDAVSQGVWVCDAQGVVKRVNRVSLDLNGVLFSDVQGKSMRELEDLGYFEECATLEAIRTKKSVTKLVQINRSGIKILTTAKPVFDQSGRLVMTVGTETNISEQEALHELLRKKGTVVNGYLGHLKEYEFLENCSAENFVARSPVMVKTLIRAQKASETDSVILIGGESGVGKTKLAGLIHQKSQVKAGPFFSLNCAAIPETLIESELFGYEKGAFTGAGLSGKTGLLELADQGTLFLDEISELSWAAQSKLLKALEEKSFLPVGGKKVRRVSIRLIAATNRDLESLVKEKLFRADLYYRLNVIPIHLPPLRERRECLAFLINHFFEFYQKKFDKKFTLRPRAMKYLLDYAWPGNIRELINVMEQIAALNDSCFVEPDDLPLEILAYADDYARPQPPPVEGGCSDILLSGADEDWLSRPLKDSLERLEKKILGLALEKCGSQNQAAHILGLSQPSISRRLRRHALV